MDHHRTQPAGTARSSVTEFLFWTMWHHITAAKPHKGNVLCIWLGCVTIICDLHFAILTKWKKGNYNNFFFKNFILFIFYKIYQYINVFFHNFYFCKKIFFFSTVKCTVCPAKMYILFFFFIIIFMLNLYSTIKTRETLQLECNSKQEGHPILRYMGWFCVPASWAELCW